jgi:hypothetical protein
VEVTEGENSFVHYIPISPACETCHTRANLQLRQD